MKPYKLRVRGNVVDVEFNFFAFTLEERRIISEMKAWCKTNGGTYDIGNKFLFEDARQVTLFLLRWS